jgi:DNA replication and repair protein RecF
VYISRLALDHFRSWEHCVVDFTPGINILRGANGLGKTNIVEAIEVLSTGSSHRTASSLPLVERGATAATIRANVSAMAIGESLDNSLESVGGERSRAQRVETYEATIAARGANRARINGGPALYLRDIVGRIPSVSFTPEDQRLVTADPALRRHFLDQAGALLIPGYIARLQTCTRIAKQRAALLKQLERSEGDASATLSGLEIWTGQFIEAGIALTMDRQRIVNALREPLSVIYDALAGAEPTDVALSNTAITDPTVQAAQSGRVSHAVQLAYEPSFGEVFAGVNDASKAAISRHFQRIYPGEIARGQNLIGPHRDDMSLELEGMPAREFASNGEMWTIALALKMALFEVVKKKSDMAPIVILDDVFAQLDETRRQQILAFAAAQQQVFITVAARGDIPVFADADKAVIPNTIDVSQLKASVRGGDAQIIAQLQAMRGEAGA